MYVCMYVYVSHLIREAVDAEGVRIRPGPGDGDSRAKFGIDSGSRVEGLNFGCRTGDGFLGFRTWV